MTLSHIPKRPPGGTFALRGEPHAHPLGFLVPGKGVGTITGRFRMMPRTKMRRIWTTFPGNRALHWARNELINNLGAIGSDSRVKTLSLLAAKTKPRNFRFPFPAEPGVLGR